MPDHWFLAVSGTVLDARYRDGFASCSASPCTVPNIAVPAGNRIPGVARTALAAAAFAVAGAHVGYVVDAGRWQVTTTARIDN